MLDAAILIAKLPLSRKKSNLVWQLQFLIN